MKILMLLSRCDQTGMTTHSLDLAQAETALGHDVTLLVGRKKTNNSKESDLLYQQFVELGISVVPFYEPDYKSVMGGVKSAIEILLYLAFRRFDIIHVQSPYLSFIPWLLRKKFVSTLHVNDLVRCFYYKNATHLIAISRETKEYAKKVFGYQDKDITIVNHGVSLKYSVLLSEEQMAEEKYRRGIPMDKLLIGLVGSIERRKGHDVLLHAVASLPKKLQEQIAIVFVGSSKDGSTNEWLDKLIEETKLQNIVYKFPYQSAEVFYKLFDIFVLPSRLEGFGLVVIEAMLANCCVLRSNTEGAFEQIDSGKNGFIFENENVEQLKDILLDLITHEEKRISIAKAGREKALKCFISEVMAKNTINVYKKVINEY